AESAFHFQRPPPSFVGEFTSFSLAVAEYASTNVVEANMSTSCRSVLLAFVAGLLAVFALSCNVEARQGFGGFFLPAPFWSGPYYEPPPWRERYYGAPRKHHYAPPRKRKIVRSERRKVTQSTTRRAALAVPNGAAKASPPISCEQAQAIVAEF